MTPKEFALLRCLMQNKNLVMSREQLLVKCWGYDYEGESRAVDTHIKRLREKLGDYAECIKTVIKAGYRLEGDDEKISKGYRIASALFLIWAIVDFRNYATIGKDLVAYYSGESIIWELVQDKLFQGIVRLFWLSPSSWLV